MENIPVCIGMASGIGAEKRGAEMGVWDMYYSLPEMGMSFSHVLYTDDLSRKKDAVTPWGNLSRGVKDYIAGTCSKDDQFLFMTGDHSNGFSVWNSMLSLHEGEMGLIWMDAHLDAHTMKSSESKNIHGMPISHLLGYGDTPVADLVEFPLSPQKLCFIGTRDYEPAERAFLEGLGVKIMFMNRCGEDALQEVITEAVEYVSSNNTAFGISIDLDGFDPSLAPGTGCFCPNGLDVEIVKNTLSGLSQNPLFCGLEISEFDPSKDKDGKTKNVVLDLIQSVFI